MRLHRIQICICLAVSMTACGADKPMIVPDSGGGDASPDSSASDSSASDSSASDSSASDSDVPDTGGGLEPCTTFDDGVVLGNVESRSLDEISGVAASRGNADVLWVHNDSGDSARVFALRTDGRHLGEYALVGATNRDWEDIAIGPGPDAGVDYLYASDTGDNAARDTGSGRAGVVVYRVPEPLVAADQTPVMTDLGDVEALPLVYPAGPHDCEALMVDPDTADLYLLTKENDGQSQLYIARAPLVADVETTLERVGELTFGVGGAPGGPFATAGDLSPNGRSVLIRTYSAVLLFLVPPGATVAEALMTTPVELPAARELQGEGIAWAPDGLGYYTVSEFVGPPLNFYAADASCAP